MELKHNGPPSYRKFSDIHRQYIRTINTTPCPGANARTRSDRKTDFPAMAGIPNHSFMGMADAPAAENAERLCRMLILQAWSPLGRAQHAPGDSPAQAPHMRPRSMIALSKKLWPDPEPHSQPRRPFQKETPFFCFSTFSFPLGQA